MKSSIGYIDNAPAASILLFMNASTPAPSPDDDCDSERRINTEAQNDALRQLGEAIAHLHGDTDWIIRSLTETILAMRPVAKDRLNEEQKRLLIELDASTPEQLEETMKHVDRGALQLGAAEVFLSHLYGTLSLAQIADYLGWEEETVQTAVAEDRLYAIEIGGRLRFPSWQLSVSHKDKLLPGLAELLQSLTPRWGWQSATAFMNATQSNLVLEGRQTPAEFLRRGGQVNEVRAIVESSDWR